MTSYTIVGIINVTPDSFSDGGQFISPDDAIETALDMIEHGVAILDIGGESSRPGATPVAADEELRRVIPVIAGIRRGHPTIPISIDTTKAIVARAACDAGATIINDISAGNFDADMFAVAREHHATMILMHMQGTPQTMQHAPQYDNVAHDVAKFLAMRREVAIDAGIPAEKIWLDPGFGFGKTLEQNLTLLKHLNIITELGAPVVIGVSRKSMLGALLGGAGITERLEAGLAIIGEAARHGATIFRVHDVLPTMRYLRTLERILV